MHASDMPPFAAVIKLELVEAAALVSAVKKRPPGLCGVSYNVHAVSLRRAFPAYIFAAEMARLK